MKTDLEDSYRAFRDALITHGVLLGDDAWGVYGLGQVMVEVLERLDDSITRLGRTPATEVMRFPPIMSRRLLETYGYMQTFPDLVGTIHSFLGDFKEQQTLLTELRAGADWGSHQKMSDVVLTPAACYAVYPRMTGNLPYNGRVVDVDTFCFRQEPSEDPARMRAFRLREFVRLGDAGGVLEWRDGWAERGMSYLLALGLEPQLAPATDPFFGPGAKLMAAMQREQNLKLELLAPVASTQNPTALMSCNYHMDHFAGRFAIFTQEGEVAHTACVGFGMERIALALFSKHGFDPAVWPAATRDVLWP